MQETAFKNRRTTLLSKIEGGVAIIPSNDFKTRSNDTEFSFRQSSDFKYLTGFGEASSVLVLTTKDDVQKSILFVQPKNELQEMWMGRRMGVEKADDILGMDEVYSIEKFEEMLPEILVGHKAMFYDLFDNETYLKLSKALASINGMKKRKVHKPTSLNHLVPLIGAQKLLKDQNEISFMKTAAAATNIAHRAAMAMAAPGKSEADVHNLMEYLFKQEGASGNAYDSIVAGGENALVLHYIDNNKTLNDGELLLIDAGSEVNLYASDVTRTFPINGKFTDIQKDLYQLTLEAQKTGLSKSLPGRTLAEVHLDTSRMLAQGLKDFGLFNGDVDGIIESGELRKYYPHGTSHWLGLDVHDNCPYLDENLEDIKLEEGMCFTIEPGLYFSESAGELPSGFAGVGIRIEDDILITKDGHDNLTSSIPKEIKEVEEACNADYREFLA